MKDKLIHFCRVTDNLILRQRARRVLRLRYGVIISKLTQARNPAWLSAHGM